MARRVHVVDDVDAADERNALIDVTQLAMETAQPVRPEVPGMDFRSILEQIDPALDQPPLQWTREVMPGAPSIDEHADTHAARGRRDQGVGDRAPRFVVGEDVRLDPYFALGVRDRVGQRRKVLRAVAQQRHRIPRGETVHRETAGRHDQRRRFGEVTSNVAASAAWSDIRAPGVA